jgi:hypothetical protein
VNRNVTTPEGAGTSAECHNKRCCTLNITGQPRQRIMRLDRDDRDTG